MTKALQYITCSVKPNAVRHETWQGKKYVVVPTVMMTEGVHTANAGAVYYPAEELSRAPFIWNMKPVIDYHPEKDESACSKEVVDAQGLGILMNSGYKDKLFTEAWLEESKIYGPSAIDQRIGNSIDKNEMVEVSLGVFVDLEESPGEFKGEKYKSIARNMRPDHLAILPDKEGACSIKKGAGLLRNESANEKMTSVNKLLSERYPNAEPNPWAVDVWEDTAVYYTTYEDLYEIAIGKDPQGNMQLVGQPAKVDRATKYVRADGSYVGNVAIKSSKEKETEMATKKELVDSLIANEATDWSEAEREYLMTQDEKSLAKFVPKPVKVENKKEEPKKEEKKEEPKKEEPVKVENAVVLTTEQYIANASPEVRDMLNQGMQTFRAERKRLINTIIANAKNPFKEDYLEKRDMEELRGLAQLAKTEEQEPQHQSILNNNYFGAAGAPPEGQHVCNEVLGLPSMLEEGKYEIVDQISLYRKGGK